MNERGKMILENNNFNDSYIGVNKLSLYVFIWIYCIIYILLIYEKDFTTFFYSNDRGNKLKELVMEHYAN